jgi:hypothetical protein
MPLTSNRTRFLKPTGCAKNTVGLASTRRTSLAAFNHDGREIQTPAAEIVEKNRLLSVTVE